MNKLKLLTFLLLSAAFLIQSCKKDTVTAVAYTTAPFQANIDGATWAPDTTSTSITYNSATKTKTFNISGTRNARQIIMSITIGSSSNTPGFTLNTFNVDSAGKVAIQYNTQQLNGSGQYVFMPQGTVAPGGGIINVTAVDSVKKQITGTFSFYSRSTLYDTNGNVVSINVDNILGGEFTNMPYTFTSN
jgi:hypothetical protein